MEEFDNDFFGFGIENNEEFEQTNNFNYDSISGLGESDYENDDLFSMEVNNTFNNNYDMNFSTNNYTNENINSKENNFELYKEEEFEEVQPQTSNLVEESVNETVEIPLNAEKTEDQSKITISETPIEQLNKLTEFKEETIEETDINSLFDKVSVNVSEASDIFRKNSDLKKKIDTRFEELKKLQAEIEVSRKKQIDEVNSYKEEVLNKLTEKKEEIEKRLNLLKDSQVNLEKEKQEFQKYKKEEQEKIEKVQKEVQNAYDDRREELGRIEDVLRKQKDALDEERSQLSLDRIQYESDKNELANNLLKFNELVNSFKTGVSDIKE